MIKNQGGRESRPDEVGRALKELGDSSDIQFVASRYRGMTHMARRLIQQLATQLLETQEQLEEVKRAYLETTALNVTLSKKVEALRVAVRELTGTEPKEMPDPEEAAKKRSGFSIEIDLPKDKPEEKECTCGHHVEMTVLREDELPPELREVLAQIRARS